MTTSIEWLSIRAEAPEPPTDADRALWRAAFAAGADAIRTVLDGSGRSDVLVTLTVYPLTHDEDVAARSEP